MKAVVCVAVAVLVVIGIGLAIVGGLPTSIVRTYGPASFRFSAAFPTYEGGKVSAHILPTINGTPAFVSYFVATTDYLAQVIGARDDTTLGSELLRPQLRSDLVGYRTHTSSTRGITTTLASPTCDNQEQANQDQGFGPGVCSDVEIVRGGGITWIARAGAEGYIPTLPQDFVKSFHPTSWGNLASIGPIAGASRLSVTRFEN